MKYCFVERKIMLNSEKNQTFLFMTPTIVTVYIKRFYKVTGMKLISKSGPLELLQSIT